MRLQLYLVKRLVTNPYNLISGLGFDIFWLFMFAFVFTSGLPSKAPAITYQAYVAEGFAWIALIALAIVGTGLVFTMNRTVNTVPYLIRYSKAKGSDYISGIVISGILTSLPYAGIVLVLTYAMFSYTLSSYIPAKDITPANVPLALLYIILAGIFFVSFALFLETIRVKYIGFKPSTDQIIAFIPLIFTFIFGFTSQFFNLGDIIYFSPFTDIEYLLAQAYYPHKLYLYTLGAIPSTSVPVFSPLLGIGILLAWIAVFLGVALALFSRIYYRSVYEGQIA